MKVSSAISTTISDWCGLFLPWSEWRTAHLEGDFLKVSWRQSNPTTRVQGGGEIWGGWGFSGEP
jgi:hypothetical protein